MIACSPHNQGRANLSDSVTAVLVSTQSNSQSAAVVTTLSIVSQDVSILVL